MNARPLFALTLVFASVALAQTPAAGTITAIDAGTRIDADGDMVFDTAVTGVNQHPGFCGFFAKQAESGNGLMSNVATALDVIDNLTPGSQPTRGQTARELVPVADLVNQAYSGGAHSPDVRSAWTTGCTSNGGDLGGERFAYRLRGNLHITSAGTKTFMVNSDDGYSLRIGYTTVMEYNANRGPAGDTRRVSFAQPGVYPIELIYWEQGGNSTMELLMADSAVCFNGTTATSNCTTYTDRSNAAVLTAAQAAGFTIMGSTQVAPATWSTVADRCTPYVGQPNTLCSAPLAASCGNGVRETVSGGGTEGCDDGNTTAGDGCSATCAVETGYVCSGPSSVCVPNAPAITAPAAGATLTTTTPVISGTGNVGATVTVREGATTVCTATVVAGGTWSCTASPALAQGAHSVTATQTDSGGRMSAASAARGFSIDTVAPALPVVSTPAAGSTTADNTPDFSGTAEPGATVRVFVDGSATPACSAVAGPGGAWSCTASSLLDGSRSVRASATDAAGNASALTTAFSFTVDTAAPAAPVISSPVNGATLNTGTPTVSGTAEANSSVTVLVDGVSYCTTTASALGAFSCAGSTALSEGAHAITARAADAVGNTSVSSSTVNVTIDTLAPASPTLSTPASGANLATLMPSFSGTAEAGATVRVFVDGSMTPSCTAVASGLGAWSCSATLTEGAHTVQVQAVDTAGNSSLPTASSPFTLDVTAPALPVITTPTANAAVGSTTPTISGSAEANALVTVFVDGVAACSTAASAAGAWSCVVSPAIAQGAHNATARASDAAGNQSGLTAARPFTVDTVAPPVPVITTPAANALVNTTTPTISGTAEANATVSVFVDGNAACTATANASGAWSCAVSPAIAQGAHNATARATDAAGNQSALTAQRPFTVDSLAPAVPVINVPAANAFVTTTTPTISGTAEANATVSVFVDGTAACTATANASGAWSCVVSPAIAQGAHNATARATDAAGNQSALTAQRPFTVDSIAPPVPVINVPAANAFVTTTTPTISGTAEANATVSVFVDGTAACTATANASGAWSCVVSPAIAQGAHNATARATDAAGNQSALTAQRPFTVDSLAPAVPVINAPAANALLTTTTPAISGTAEANATVSVFVDGTAACTATANASGAWSCTVSSALSQGAHNATARATDAAGNQSALTAQRPFTVDTVAPPAPVVSAPAAGAVTNDTTPTYSGTAEAGATVTVVVDGVTACTATATGGTWSCTATAPLTEGAHSVLARATDAAGNTSVDSSATSFTVDVTAPTVPAISVPTAGAALSDATPDISGTGEAGSTVSVFVDGGTTPVCTAVVTAGGTWSCTPSTAITDGAHTLTATASDPAGNTSGTSASVAVTVDTSAPSAPVISTPVDNAQLSDSTPAVSGTGEAGATVSVFVDGSSTAACTATVASDNSWSCNVGAALSDGAHTLTASQVDAANNTSPTSASVAITIDTAAPSSVVITSPTAGELLATSPTITGTADVGTTVTVFLDGSTTATCTVTVPASGTWSCATTLADGAHSASAVSTDAAGNATAPATVSFELDSAAPVAPVITAPTEGGISATSTTFSGTAEANSTVRVYVDGSSTEACTAQASSTGAWACVANNLAVGAHTATATAQDATGNTSAASMTRNFSVAPDVAPGPPVITAPADGSSVNDATPTVSGQAALLSTVHVYVDGSSTPACTATTDASGNFSCDLSPALTEGAHTVTATATVVGVVGMPSAPVGFTVDLTAPVAPVIAQPVANATTGARPTISGTAEANATVSVFVDGNTAAACSAQADMNGVWVCSPATALADGAHTLVARAVDAAGNTSVDSNSVAITVDGSLPVSPPTITSPVAQASLNDATPTITGTAPPFASVAVFIDGAAMAACSATAAADGTWSCTPTTALTDGAHTVNATATDANGTSAPSMTIDFSVDTLAPVAPVVTSPTANQEVARTPTITGTAEANAAIEVRVDGQVVCTTTADASGAWSCALTQALPPGAHTVNATAIDAATNRSQASADVAFTVVDAPSKPAITSPTAGATLFDTTPDVSGTAQPGSTVTVTVDGATYCTTTADQTGAFSCAGSGALALGMHTVTATSTTPGGTATSDAVTFEVDDAPPPKPATPVITKPTAGATLVDNTPTFSGTAEAGTTVSVRVDGVEVCTAVAASDGTFSCTATSALADGAHNVTATATRAGVSSDASAPVAFSITTVPPVVISPTGGGVTPRTPDVTGTAAPGSTVVVRVNGEEVCTTTADENGNFVCSLDKPLPPGEASLVVEIVDEEGNTLRSDPVSVRVVAGSVAGGGIGCTSSPSSSLLWLAALVVGFLFTRRSRHAGAALAAAAVVSRAAQAQTVVAPFELERVRLNPGAADGLLQEGGALLDPMALRVSLFGHYQHNPLVVRENGLPVASLVGSRWTAHLGAAFGITDWLEAGVQVPVVLSQTGNAEGTGYTPVTNVVALGTPWLQVRGGILRERSGAPLDLSAGLAVGLPLGSAEALTRENTVTAVPTIGVGKRLGSMFRVGGNVAFALRPASSLNDGSMTQVGSYMTTGLVLSTTGKVLRGEISGRLDIPFTQSPVAGELYAGVRWAPHQLFELALIGGPGFGTQPGTPAFRVLLGAAFTPSFGGEGSKPAPVKSVCVDGQPHDPKVCPELDLDGDGTKNADDACVDAPGVLALKGCADVDDDGDGVLNLSDKCVKVPGVRELDGCPEPDGDKDGIPDARDACPAAAGPIADAGCPDSDGDGFDDAHDLCVNEAGVAAMKGCPDVDTDGDGVVDRLDNCVKEKGVAANQGCPAKQKQLVVITAEKLVILDKVYFATGKATVLPKSDKLLQQVARVLVDHPDVKLVIVEGHTDNVGKAEKNLTLSQQRADSVRERLIKFGVDGARLQAKGYGDTRPLEDNKTAKGREANRRVEFVLGHE